MSAHSALNAFSNTTIKNGDGANLWFENKILSSVLNEFGIP
jgi:hypothetical protein